jgi:di/tricarboxylate transporter
MQYEQWSIIAVIFVTLILFVWGKLRYDVIALLALFSSVLIGLVPVETMFEGFGHPATITVAIVLILSYGLAKSGAIEGIVGIVNPLAKTPSLHIAALIFIAAFFSMFMNNVGALALLMPVAIQSTHEAKRSPSTMLMPLSFGSILGGLVTMIGTPPNIIIATYREEAMGEPFTMFDFSPVGSVVAIAGILFMAIIGWRFVKVRKTVSENDAFEIESYLFQVKVPKDSDIHNLTIDELNKLLVEYKLMIASLMYKKQYTPIPPKAHKITTSDMIILEGAHDDIDKFISKHDLDLVDAENISRALTDSNDMIMTEVVIAPRSKLEGRKVENVRFKYNYNVNLLAISRESRPYRGHLRSMTLRAGDVLLLHGAPEDIDDAIGKWDCFPLAERGVDLGKRKHAMPALAIFAAAIALPLFDIVPIQVSMGLAVIAFVLFNILPVRELYDGVDWPVIVLLGAMIPVGGALETTGTTQILANGLLNISGDISIVVVLTLVLVITMTLSDILNNAATAILMAPIAKTIAEVAEVNVDPFLMAVAIGASCAFLTPIGHQNNALVMGPGGYKFRDYWRVGLPLEIIIVVVAIPMILLVWPL